MSLSRWSGGQPWQLLPFNRRGHCWCALCSTSPPANCQCSHGLVLAPFCMTCSLHLISIWFLQAICLPEWSLQLPSFFAFHVSKGRGPRGSFKFFLRTLCFHFAVKWSLQSTCYCLALSQFAPTTSKKIRVCHQSTGKYSAANPSPCFGTMPHIIACVCSPLCYHLSYTILHIIAWVHSFVSITATAPLSVCHEALVKTLPIQADLSWSPLPLVPLCNAAFYLFPQFIISCSHFAFFVWTVTCRVWPWKP